jgi:hypothetical protein
VHHASKRPLIQGRTIRVPIDHTVPDLSACRRRGGFQVGCIARKKAGPSVGLVCTEFGVTI